MAPPLKRASVLAVLQSFLTDAGTVFAVFSAVVLGVFSVFGTFWVLFAKDDVQEYIRYQILLALSGYNEEYIRTKGEEDQQFLTTKNLLQEIEMPGAAEDLRRRIDAVHLLEFSREYDFELNDDGSFKKDEYGELLKTEIDKSTRWFHATEDQYVCLAFRFDDLSAQLARAMARNQAKVFARIGEGEDGTEIRIDRYGVKPTWVHKRDKCYC